VTDAAIIKATYSEWKMVKTRKVLVLSFEVPLEAQETVQAALGTPMPDAETWVAIARLRQGGAEPVSEPAPAAIEHQPEPPIRRSKSLAQIAGILCATGSFQKFAGASNEQEAADYIRGHCGVASRAEIDSSENATRVFKDIKADYDFWMAGGVAAA
jgi:hypothetical protein